jgi:hypothetical protein
MRTCVKYWPHRLQLSNQTRARTELKELAELKAARDQSDKRLQVRVLLSHAYNLPNKGIL